MTTPRHPLRELRLLASIPLRADRRRTILAFVLRPVSAITVPVSALLLKRIVDSVTAGDARTAVVAGVVLGAAGALLYLLQLAAWRLSIGLEDGILGHLQARLAETVASIPTLAPFESPEVLDDLTIVRDRHRQFSRTIFKLPEGVAYVVGAAAGIALLVSIHPLLASLPLFGIPTILFGYRGERHLIAAEDATAEPTRQATQLITLASEPASAKELRVFGVQDVVRYRQRELWDLAGRIYLRSGLRWSAWWGAGWFVFGLGFAGAVAFVTLRAAAGHATPGDVVMTIALASELNGQVDLSVNLVVGVARAMRTAARMLRLIDLADAHATRDDHAAAPDAIREAITVDGLSFRYAGSDVDALVDVDLTFPAGSTVALVGDNGAGKTTLVKLLACLHDPTSGRVLADGTDLRSFSHHAWQERVAAGFQDFAKLEFLVRESVGVGCLDEIDSPRVLDALDRAGGSALLERLPSGLETQLGPRWDDGVALSEGQWQKVALARTLMQRTPLVRIFDEPTSALDAQTEHDLFERVAVATSAERASGTVTVLVSHRFSTVRMADLIVVLDGGRVIETGTHDELIARDGLYAKLYELQARAYK